MISLDRNHIYRMDGLVIPSVTQVLVRTGFVDGSWHTENAKTRGSHVHLAAVFYDHGTLDEETLHPTLKGYVDAYKKFRAEIGFLPTTIEKPMAHPVLRYAGTPDRIGQWGIGQAILDIKTGVPAPWHRYQLSAYAMLADNIEFYRFARMSLYLRPDGTFSLVKHTDRDDAKIWLAALTVFNALGME